MRITRATLASQLRNPWLQLGFGTLLSLGALALTLRGLDLREVGKSLLSVQPAYVAGALAVHLFAQWVKAWRWRSLLGPRRPALGLPALASLLVIGQAVNLMVPARLGELVRAYLTGSEGNVSKAFVLGTLAAEKLLDLVALAVLFLGLIPLMAFPAWLAPRTAPVVAVALGVVGAVVAALATRRAWLRAATWMARWLPARWGTYLEARLDAGLAGLASLANPGQALAAWLWTLLIWFLGAVANLLLMLAFRLPATWLWAFFLLAVMQAGGTVPAGPGRLGVFEYLCQLSLLAVGVPATIALGYGLLLHALIVGSIGAWAAAAIWHRSRSPWRLMRDSANWQPAVSLAPNVRPDRR